MTASGPAMASAPHIPGLPPLHSAIVTGDAAAAATLLAGDSAASSSYDGRGVSALSLAAYLGHADIVGLLLSAGASPMQPDGTGSLPLHRAAARGKAEAIRLLLAAAPEAAFVPDAVGHLPSHYAANMNCGEPQAGGLEALELLCQAAPASLLTHIASEHGGLPLHCAVAVANRAAVEVLLKHAPAAAMVRSHPQLGNAGLLPLSAALGLAAAARRRKWPRGGQSPAAYLDAARPLLAVMPPEAALPILAQRGQLALPLFGDLVAQRPLSRELWQQVPSGCPSLGRALPAVLERSEAEAAQLVARLPAADRQRLRTFALSLHRHQRQMRVYLPTPLVHRILALFDA